MCSRELADWRRTCHCAESSVPLYMPTRQPDGKWQVVSGPTQAPASAASPPTSPVCPFRSSMLDMDGYVSRLDRCGDKVPS